MENKEKKPQNPNAFPSYIIDHRESAIQCRTVYEGQEFGITLRDYFAAKAMQGLLSNTEWMHIHKGNKFLMHDETIADTSYSIADAMLKEREKE